MFKNIKTLKYFFIFFKATFFWASQMVHGWSDHMQAAEDEQTKATLTRKLREDHGFDLNEAIGLLKVLAGYPSLMLVCFKNTFNKVEQLQKQTTENNKAKFYKQKKAAMRLARAGNEEIKEAIEAEIRAEEKKRWGTCWQGCGGIRERAD